MRVSPYATDNSSTNGSMLDPNIFCIEYLGLREDTRAETVFKLTAYTVAFLLAIIGNSLVIAIVLRKIHFKTTTNLFIINMALTDVMMAFVCMPATMYSIASKSLTRSILDGHLGAAMCKLLPFLQGLSIAVSILTVTALAADRFLAIVYPFGNFISMPRARILIVALWIVGVLFNVPTLYAMTTEVFDNTTYCYEKWEPHFDNTKATRTYTISLFVCLYVIPLILITFFYAALVHELWQGHRRHSNRTRALTENKSVLKMVLTVVVVFAVCWLPVHVTFFVVYFPPNEAIQRCGVNLTVVFIGWFMGHANSAINPFIYFIFNENFRREILTMFRKVCVRCVRKRLGISDRPLGGSQSGAARSQTQAVSISSNEDKNHGQPNDAFEMTSENDGTAAAPNSSVR